MPRHAHTCATCACHATCPCHMPCRMPCRMPCHMPHAHAHAHAACHMPHAHAMHHTLVSPDIIFSSYTYCSDCMKVPPMVRSSPTASWSSPPPPSSPPSSLSSIMGDAPTRQTAKAMMMTPAHMCDLSSSRSTYCFINATKTARHARTHTDAASAQGPRHGGRAERRGAGRVGVGRAGRRAPMQPPRRSIHMEAGTCMSPETSSTTDTRSKIEGTPSISK